MKQLKALFWSSRPISWVNTAYPFFATYVFVTGSIDAKLLIGTFFFLIPYNFLMYGINDVFDYESDLRNPRKGGIEGALLDPSLHKLTIWASIGLALGFVVYLLVVGSDIADFWLLITLAAVVAYSVPKIRFKEVPFLDSLTSSLHFIGPMLFALALSGADIFEFKLFSMLLAFLGWGIASHAFGAVQDVKADREAGIKSVATAIGARNTVRFSFVLYFLAGVTLMNAGPHGMVAALTAIPYMIIISPYLSITDGDCERANRGWRKFIFLNFAGGALISVLLINFVQAS